MAATLSKNILIKAQRHHRCLYYSWNRSLNRYSSDQAAAPANRRHHSIRFSRFKHNFRNIKENESISSKATKLPLVQWYLCMLKTRPIVTKSVTASLIYTVADVTSQAIVGKIEEYELMRTLRMAGYGMLILGPSVHYWYNFMSKVFPKQDLLSTFKKMALGQTLYGPAMTVIFFSVNAALQGESSSEIVARLKRDLLPTMINGIMYWPVCDFVTFKFIPVHLQPLVINSFSYLWTVYITYMASLTKVGAG